MKTKKKTITVDKKPVDVDIFSYESIEELLSSETSEKVLSYFNYRHEQIQAQERKKDLKPKKLTKKELRTLAFNKLTRRELLTCHKNPEKLETILAKKIEDLGK